MILIAPRADTPTVNSYLIMYFDYCLCEAKEKVKVFTLKPHFLDKTYFFEYLLLSANSQPFESE